MTQSAPQNDLATDDVADAVTVPPAAPTTPTEPLEPAADADADAAVTDDDVAARTTGRRRGEEGPRSGREARA